jgi:hypothetical protein
VVRFLLACLLVLGSACAAAPSTVGAQPTIQIRATDVPLATALAQVRAEASLQLVYADRLVDGRRATCTYTGTVPRDALACVLSGTGVEAKQVRRRQYVLVAAASGESPAKPRASVNGYVRDADTGERLPGAHVYLTELRAGATTNQDGYFVLSDLPSGPYKVRISYLGYQSVDTTLYAGEEPAQIALVPTAIASEGVVVEAGSTSVSDRQQLPGMMSVALGQVGRLPSLGEPDLFRALRWTPGIRKPGVLAAGLTVRGAKPDQNLYLLDGAPVYHPWHAFSLISTFQTGTLQSTALYRGSFPAEHGGRLSAVLDAQMKDGSRRSPTAVAALSLLSGRFRVETPLTSSTSFMLSGRRSYIDKLVGRRHPVTGPNGRRDTLRTGYYFFDTSAKVTHRFGPAHRLSLSYYHGRDDLDLRLPFDLSLDFSSWLRPADLLFEVAQNWDNRVFSGQHRVLLGDALFLTSTAYYSGYRAQEASFVQPTTTASLTSDYRVRLSDVGTKIHVNYHPSMRHEWTAGLEVAVLQFESWLDSELRRSRSTVTQQAQATDVRAVRMAAYLQDSWTPTPRWTVEPGLRASYFGGGDRVHLAPRLSAQYVVDPRWLVLEGSAGVQVQYLHRLRDRYSLAYDLVSSRWVPSSERVAPALGGQLGLGTYTQLRPGWSLEVDAYLRGTRQMLVPTDVFQEKEGIDGPGIEVGALLGQYTAGAERALGVEVSMRYERGPWRARLAVSGGRTYVRAPARTATESRWRPSSLDVPVSARSFLGWTNGRWGATIAAEVRSGSPITVPEARYRLGDPTAAEPTAYLYRPEVNNGRLPPYVRLDLTLQYTFQLLSTDWTASVDVFNLTNRDNVVDRTYRPTDTGVIVDRQRGLPVLPVLELKMEL